MFLEVAHLERQIKIYWEAFENLPERFRKKIESDLQYLIRAGIPICSEAAPEEKREVPAISTC